MISVQRLVGANLTAEFTTFLTEGLGRLRSSLALLFARNGYRILNLLGSLGLWLGKNTRGGCTNFGTFYSAQHL